MLISVSRIFQLSFPMSGLLVRPSCHKSLLYDDFSGLKKSFRTAVIKFSRVSVFGYKSSLGVKLQSHVF